MATGGLRALITLCIAAAALVAGYLLGRSERGAGGPPVDARDADASALSSAERSASRARQRAGRGIEANFFAPQPDAGPDVGAEFELAAPQFRLRVRSRDGEWVADACVTLIAVTGPKGDWIPLSNTSVSGRDGSVAVGVPQSVFEEITSVEVRVTGDGFVSRNVIVSREAALRGTIEVNLERTVEVRGRCVDRARQAIGGVRVHGPRGVVQTTTDAEGRFLLAELTEPGGYVRFLPDERPFAATRVDLPASSDGIVDLGDVVLEAGETLRGRFLDAAGNPIAGARVFLANRTVDTFVAGAATTDAEGRFTFEHVGRGTIDVGLLRPGVDLDGGDFTNIAYDVRASEEVVVRATRDHYVGVEFVDDDRQAVQFRGGRITWFALDDPTDRLDWWGLDGGWDHFHIAARPGATYEVRVELDGYEPTIVRATATESRDTHVDAVLRRKK